MEEIWTTHHHGAEEIAALNTTMQADRQPYWQDPTSGDPAPYTHLRAHETPEELECRHSLAKKNNT